MPKTKDAFALRDFDEKRILQRPYFQALGLPTGSDDEILSNFNLSINKKSAVMEANISILRNLGKLVALYQKRIVRHCERLKRFFLKCNSLQERTAILLRRYSWYSEVIELFRLKFGSLYADAEKSLDTQYRREFATRLKTARIAAGLTQAAVALRLGMSRNGYQYYESGTRDPSIPTLIRLTRILRCSIDDLIKTS